MSHTPGPWTVESDGTTLVMDGQIVATAIAPDGARIDEQRANARLIAAAPDLLVALQAVLRVADRATVEFDAARAAIAKATTP